MSTKNGNLVYYWVRMFPQNAAISSTLVRCTYFLVKTPSPFITMCDSVHPTSGKYPPFVSVRVTVYPHLGEVPPFYIYGHGYDNVPQWGSTPSPLYIYACDSVLPPRGSIFLLYLCVWQYTPTSGKYPPLYIYACDSVLPPQGSTPLFISMHVTVYSHLRGSTTLPSLYLCMWQCTPTSGKYPSFMSMCVTVHPYLREVPPFISMCVTMYPHLGKVPSFIYICVWQCTPHLGKVPPPFYIYVCHSILPYKVRMEMVSLILLRQEYDTQPIYTSDR